MNFFRRLINKTKAENLMENSKEKTDFISDIFYNLAEMKLKLENISSEKEIYEKLKDLIENLEEYIEKSSDMLEERTLEDKLSKIISESNVIVEIKLNPEIPQLTMDKVNQELIIEEYYRKVKAIYEVKYQKATQKILMKKAERINTSFDLIDNQISLEELKSYFEILVQNKKEFSGIMQNRYVEILIEIEYKISMLECFANKTMDMYKKVENNKAKELIWSRLFINDIEKFINESDDAFSEDLKEVLEKRKLKGESDKIFTQSNLESYFLAMEGRKKAIEDKKIYKEIADYQDIIEDQKKIAKSKGLANSKNFLETDDIKIYKKREEELPLICDILNDQGDKYEIYRDIDECNDVYIVTSRKAQIDDIDINIEVYNNAGGKKYTRLVPITKEFAKLYSKYTKKIPGYIDYPPISKIGKEYYLMRDWIDNYKFEEYMGSFLYHYKSKNYGYMSNGIDDEKGKFYIEIPYKRTIIPILEKLKEEEIEFTIPPIDFNEKIQIKDPVIKIYINIADSIKYEVKVHDKISTPEKGIIKICRNGVYDHEIRYIMRLLIEGCKYERKKEIMEYIAMSRILST